MESIYNNWDEAAEAWLRRMIDTASNSPKDRHMFDPIEIYFIQWIRRVTKGDLVEGDIDLAVDVLFRAGVTAMQALASEDKFSLTDMHELLVRKQHDYGHDNINSFGIIGICIRLCDKIARIRNLQGRDTNGLNEPLHDSYMDVIGYATVACMYHDGSFQLKLKGDIK